MSDERLARIDFHESTPTVVIEKGKSRNVASLSPVSRAKITPNCFDLLCTIGQGAFGKVLQVRYKPTLQIYAMKIVCKNVLVKKNSVSYMKAERDIMTKINHPFVAKLKFAFQTDRHVYLVMPYVAGGELFNRLQKECMILEDAARFYAAEMVLALEHLHASGIVHRDLKPENILISEDGHVVLTDFGLAKEMSSEDDMAKTICGTNEYMAPEMIRGKQYNQAVDWWALGALLFEMLTGKPPFSHRNKKKLHQKILYEKFTLPKHLHSSTHSIIKQLLERNIDKRLGSGKSTMFKIKGVQAIKNHPFFKSIDWQKLAQKKITPPLIPQIKDELDTTNFDKMFTDMSVQEHSIDGECQPDLFAKFSYIDDRN